MWLVYQCLPVPQLPILVVFYKANSGSRARQRFNILLFVLLFMWLVQSTRAATPDIGHVLQGEFRTEGKAMVRSSVVCVVVYVVMWLHARAHLPLLESEGNPAAR